MSRHRRAETDPKSEWHPIFSLFSNLRGQFWLVVILISAMQPLSPVKALSTDFEQAIEIEADFAELDDEEGTTVYIGNVVVVQGSIRMTGDRLRVNFTPERDLKDAYMEGRLATFRQTPNEGDEDVEGEGLMIEYHAQENMIYVIGRAKVTQGERLTQGHRINYDTARSIVTVRSSRAASANKDEQKKEQSGRVRIIIPPKKKD
ncbi:MAG: lipopolysaccharide transport periplasmic protein LptA [Gammaproteobacteria bacterium]